MLGDFEKAEWPNRHASLRVEAGGLRWHVQRAGSGPTVLLLHGTGASTHSWRGLLPILAQHFDVIAPDLPGHAFTSPPRNGDYSLPSFARGVAALLDALDAEPVLAVGHSAGAPVLARMALDGTISPAGIVALNGAMLPFSPFAGPLFSGLARIVSVAPLLPSIISRFADENAVRRLLEDTGSKLDRTGIELYRRLFSDPSHISATLKMMAQWDLESLKRDLPALAVPLLLVAGTDDRTIPPEVSVKVRDIVADGRIERLRGLGHLAHEEDPARVADVVLAFAETLGVIGNRT